MNNFFAVPTDVWEDDAVMLTPVGICIVAAVILILMVTALLVYRKQHNVTASITTKQLAFSSMALALAMVTSMIKFLRMPLGGSVTLFSMLFIVLIAYWYGPVAGITTGMAYGLLQFVLTPVFYSIPQMLTDYPLAFGALGIAGFFCNKKWGLHVGYAVGVFGRFVFSFLSGLLFFADYAPESMGAVFYSFSYNGAYLLAEAVLTLIVISIPPVYSALGQIRGLAVSDTRKPR